MKYRLGTYFLLILNIGCSSQEPIDLPEHIRELENLTVYQADTEPKYTFQLVRESRFGDTEDVMIGNIGSTAVDGMGRVFIADGQESDIKVYDPEGHFLIRLGREGRGPGEFRNIGGLQIMGNRLFARDRNQHRTMVFSLDSLTYNHTINLADNKDTVVELRDAHRGDYHVRNIDTFLMGFSTSNVSDELDDWDKLIISRHYYYLDEEGNIMSEQLFETKSSIEVLIPHPHGRVGFPFEFFGRSLIGLDDERIYAAWSQDFLIKIYDQNGEYQRAFYYPYERIPLTPENALSTEFFESLQSRGGLRSFDFPQAWPALNRMLIDDENRLWISTIIDDDQVYEWWVLDENGELLSKLNLPRDRSIRAVKNGYLYTHETDELDIASIVRYRIGVEDI